MQGLATKNAPNVRLPMQFMIAGIAGYLLLQTVLFLQTGLVFSGEYLQPKVVATVHMATVAWGAMVVIGAYYQLAPVFLQVDLYSERLGHAAYWLYLPGVITLIAGFWTWTLPVIAIGGTALFVGILLFVANLAVTLRRTRWNRQGVTMAVALGYLLLTAILGISLAYNLSYNFFHRSAIQHMAFHLAVGGAGWFTLTIIGVGYRLIPMFTLAHGYPRERELPVALLVALGTAVLATAAVSGLTGKAMLLAAVPLLAGLVLFAADVARIIRHRRRRRLELVTRFTVTAVASLLLAAALTAITLGRPAVLPIPASVAATIVAYLLLMGWVSLMIVGQLYKIVPFLIWLHRYTDRAGREAVPLVSDLFSPAVGEWSFRLITVGTFGTAVTLLLGWPAAAQGAQGLALAGAALFGWAMLQVLLGLRQIPRHKEGAIEHS